MKEKSKKAIRILIALILIVFSVYFTVNKMDLSKLWTLIAGANYTWVLGTIPIALFSHWLRAMRWKTMLEPVKKGSKTWNLFSAVMVGYAMNNVLPRGGEFIRPYLYSRREKVPFSTAFATIIVERFIDLLTLVLLFIGVSFFFREQLIQSLPEIHYKSILTVVLLVLAVLIMSFYPPFVRFMLKLVVKPLSEKFYIKLTEIFEAFLKGFAIIRSPSQYFRLTTESLAIWLCYTIPMYMIFFAFKFQSQLHLGFDDAILLIVISGVGFTFAPTPGAFGVYHWLITNTLVKLYGVNPEEALAYATVTHGINYLVQVIVGGLFLLKENVQKIPQKEELDSVK